MAHSEPYDENDSANRGFYDIPEQQKLEEMSFIDLSTEVVASEPNSVRFHVFDREMKRRLAIDQREINLKNIVIGAVIGGSFGLIGVTLGYFLRCL